MVGGSVRDFQCRDGIHLANGFQNAGQFVAPIAAVGRQKQPASGCRWVGLSCHEFSAGGDGASRDYRMTGSPTLKGYCECRPLPDAKNLSIQEISDLEIRRFPA